MLSIRSGRRLTPALALLLAVLSGCDGRSWNDPYPAGDATAKVVYSSFDERPKHLDPARSYSANENVFLAQIYEPPLQYHWRLRPYRLVPLATAEMPEIRYLDATGRVLPPDTPPERVAHTDYLIALRPDLRYQPHPALARDAGGNSRYLDPARLNLDGIQQLADFPHTGSRRATAADFAYQIKRLAAPWLQSPVAGVMREHIHGFAAFMDGLTDLNTRDPSARVQALREGTITGVEVLDAHHLRIRLDGVYPQFIYWLAMSFFAPMPWEADLFYALPGMRERNLVLDWYPIGTGPFMLAENNPNLRMVLARNPNFHAEIFPAEGSLQQQAAGLLADAGRALPLVDQVVFSLEKESIPRWSKFLQGYYDSSGIGSDAFDQAVRFDATGEPALAAALHARGIRLDTSVETSVFYLGFNMLDPVVGGDSHRARLLRRAVSIAVDFEEYISIFANGRGLVAQGPLPPGLFGHREGEQGIDPYVYTWRDGGAVRRGLDEARALLAEAGYRDGVDPATGRALTLFYDSTATGPDGQAHLNWMRKQFAKLGIELVVRATDYNRFQDKLASGSAQLFMFGWNADYPDPENFLFLFYGPQGEVAHHGQNATNYANSEFDQLFERMKNLANGPERQALIDRMIAILHADAPWVWGFHPRAFVLHHQWLTNTSSGQMVGNTLKYRRVDAELRARLRRDWNRPIVWPLALGAAVLVALVLPALALVRRRERGRAL